MGGERKKEREHRHQATRKRGQHCISTIWYSSKSKRRREHDTLRLVDRWPRCEEVIHTKKTKRELERMNPE